MGREEVEFLPQGLVTCILNDREVRILKISPDSITVRSAEKEENINSIRISFYKFHEYKYEELEIKDYKVIEEEKEEFYYKYLIAIKSSEFKDNVRDIFNSYSKYIMLKNFGDENEFSERMTGYPKDEDLDFYKYYSVQKKEWMSASDYNKNINKEFELAVKIDNYELYQKYMDMNIEEFKEYYYKENYIDNTGIFNKEINRLYIGNEFCHNLFPKEELLFHMLQKAIKENLEVTLCFTYLRECYIEKNRLILEKVYQYCRDNNKEIEIVINDWGSLKIIEDKKDYFTPVLGVLLNKRKKDPRYIYKKGYKENKETMGYNSLNSSMFNKFLKGYGIERYEYESCGYKINIPKGKHSLQMPFYVTNTSQYCPLNAVCKSGQRGRQKLIKTCEKYCTDYVFMYPKHLKMIGKYNSLFAFDDTILKDISKLEKYINKGIDRIVLNFV